MADSDGHARAASSAEGGFRAGFSGGHVSGRRLPPQRRVPAELRIRILDDDGDGQNQFQICVRPLRYLRLVFAAGSACERQCEIYSRDAADVERFCEAPELRRVLEGAGNAVFADQAESAELECGGLVGPGRFLWPDENLRDFGERRPGSFELLGGGTVESRRMGRRARRFAGSDSLWQRYGAVFSAEDRGAVVCVLAEE